MKNVSIVISAFNEEKKIRKCLESARFADEIIFVDNSSTDDTVKIAKEYTKKIFTQKNDPTKIDIQKNIGIEKATGEWIFVLDADEEISPELRDEIKNISDTEDAYGFFVPRKNIIFNKWIEHSGWHPDFQLRFFKKGKGKYDKEHYHETITVTGETKKLSGHLIHHNFESIKQFLYKHMLVYAPNEAEEFLRKGYVFDYKDAVVFPLKEFLSRYFARDGYKDGFHGLVLALLMACYHFAIFAYLWEKKKFVDENKHTLTNFKSEIQQARHEIQFWMNKKIIEDEKNLVKKLGLKVKRKFHL